MLVIGRLEVSAPKNKKIAKAAEPTSLRPKRGKDKLIRLDDLIPKQNVTGGRKLLFGVTDERNHKHQPKIES